jgi:hypothetical protein
MKIGATHEKYVKSYDTNVVVQAFPGRMSGFWKDDITNGHKTGPHRTSITAVNEYIAFYQQCRMYQTEINWLRFSLLLHPLMQTQHRGIKNPLADDLSYKTVKKKVFLKRNNIINFEDENEDEDEGLQKKHYYFESQEQVKEHFTVYIRPHTSGRGPNKLKPDADGTFCATIKKVKRRYSKAELESRIYLGASNNKYWFYPCYTDTDDLSTLKFCLIHEFPTPTNPTPAISATPAIPTTPAIPLAST